MGVLQQILAENKGHWANVGGLVSPGGLSFIGDSSLNSAGGSLVIAIKRKVLDEKIARAAAAAGAQLVENFTVAGAELKDGAWTIQERGQRTYRARALVCCDGASSSLARSLGLVHTNPDSVCSRAYVKAGTHNFQADGVVYYPRDLLPGYCAIFREAGDELNFVCYIIPGGKCVPSDLQKMHAHIIQHDPHISKALGPGAELDRMRGAGLRLGGIARSYADHVLVVGDAAGHIDPLTGEGIQYAMDAAEIAAETLREGFAANNLRESMLRRYHDRWMKSFGWDFAWSRWMSQACGRFPIFLDACAAVTQRKGARFLSEWGEAMTGARPKSEFLKPKLLIPILLETGRQWMKNVAGGRRTGSR
jgi:flavin-dependent dehydrogenase